MTVRIPEPPIPSLWLLDANVLFSEWSCFFCVTLAMRAKASLFYTPLVEEEAFRNLVRLGRLSPEDALTRRAVLAGALSAHLDHSDASGYLDDVKFVQEKDRPIAASALKATHDTGQAVGLITWNIKDFPRKQLLKKRVVRYTPDELATKILTCTDTAVMDLLKTTLDQVHHFSKEYPLIKPTGFVLKAHPSPQTKEQWSEFLKRNRLNLLLKKM